MGREVAAAWPGWTSRGVRPACQHGSGLATGRYGQTMRLGQTIPALPVSDVGAATEYYRRRFGFAVTHSDDGFAVVTRDEAVIHLWLAGDDSWRLRATVEDPVRSGAESLLAGTASCRILVDDVKALYDELRSTDVLHQVSRSGVTSTDFGTREFATVDQDNNLLEFFAWNRG
jgi:catechol 2,3-dioxygenase-like lactoylglutathione lyase family enzyme